MLLIHRLIVGIVVATSFLSTASAADPIRVLFLGDDGPHQPATRFAELQPTLADRGITMTYTEDVESLNAANLKQYDALALYANIDTIAPARSRCPAELRR